MKLFCYLGLILGLLGAGVAPCYAVYEAPMARNTTLTAKYDLRSVPSQFDIWDGLEGGRDDTDPSKWGGNVLVCKSATDSSFGACKRTEPVSWRDGSPSDTYINLAFTRDGTGDKRVLRLNGRHRTGACGTYPPSSSSYCNVGGNTNLFYYDVPQLYLSSLPPGVWRATLKQDLWQWNPRKYLNTWTANLIFTVTDLNNQQVYFPAFPYSNPSVDLNLNNRPGTGNNTTASGTASLDMCLYDGSNSSSNRVNMIFRDEKSSAQVREGLFSVYRTGADKTQEANRIDYQVYVINPTTGAAEKINDFSEFSWSNTNQRNIQRQVVLPGVPGASLCVPAPIRLVTPAFKLANKTAGHYTGRLIITYTPSTQNNVSQ